jgi:replicative DNA helicase
MRHGSKIRQGLTTRKEVEALAAASEQLASLPIFMDDSPHQTTLRIAAQARRHKRQRNIRVLFVDHIGLIDCEHDRKNRQEQVSEVSRRLKLLAGELNLPVVVLCQLSRATEIRADDKPKLSDLRD